MKRISAMSQAELAAYVEARLARKGIHVTLSGGACVAVHSNGKYVSLDIDLINEDAAPRSALKKVMTELGFQEAGRHFRHPASPFIVEFPEGPTAVGREHVTRLAQRRLPTGTLRLLSPTDCVKDRLAAYYHWEDRESLEQAVLVAQAKRVDLGEIGRWSRLEGKNEEFRRIRSRLIRRRRRKTA